MNDKRIKSYTREKMEFNPIERMLIQLVKRAALFA
jgi:hypothetical protein